MHLDLNHKELDNSQSRGCTFLLIPSAFIAAPSLARAAVPGFSFLCCFSFFHTLLLVVLLSLIPF